jgi:fibro-slime domain-containing protein
VWMFLDGILVLDLGGISNKQGILNWGDVDTKLEAHGNDLVAGRAYKVDFFYTERCFCGSSIELHTNVFFEPKPIRILR